MAARWAQEIGVQYVEHPPGYRPIWTEERIHEEPIHFAALHGSGLAADQRSGQVAEALGAAVAAKQGAGAFAAGEGGECSRPSFLRPVTLLALGTAALSAGVGYLPVIGARHHLTPLQTGALVCQLAAMTALLQPWAGRAHDRATLPSNAGPRALLLVAAGFGIAAMIPNVLGIAVAAILISIGVAVSTPIGFATLAGAISLGAIATWRRSRPRRVAADQAA